MKVGKFILAAFFAASAISSQPIAAKQLSADEALRRAGVERNAIKGLQRSLATDDEVTAVERDGNTLYYIVNRAGGQGFALVSADDSFLPLIAYSDEGSFDLSDLPDNLMGMLGVLENNILCSIESQAVPRQKSVPASRATAIPNMVTSRWAQGYPYYNKTPLLNNAHCQTGCVATAMAQVMYYHKYPTSGRGSASMTAYDQELVADFENTTYRWDKMVDNFTFVSDEESVDAVSTLMLHCGVSVSMSYHTGASAADAWKVAWAMHKYFGYDDAITTRNRRTYDDETWYQMVYDELAAGRPVLYQGEDPSAGGHFFVVSGCDGEDMYYINWGWSGSANAFYSLDALNAAGYGFNQTQVAIVGIKPQDDVADDTFNMVGMGSLKIYYKDFGTTYTRRSNNTQYVMPTGTGFYGFFNFDPTEPTPKMGVIFENEATGEVTEVEAYGYTPVALATGTKGKVMSYQIRDTHFPEEGRFKMYAAATDPTGTWRKIPFDYGTPQYLFVTCTPTTFVFDLPSEGVARLQAEVGAPQGVQWARYDVEIPVKATNVGTVTYDGFLSVNYQRDIDSNIWMRKPTAVKIEPGETQDLVLKITPSYGGFYRAVVYDDASNNLGELTFVAKDPYNPVELSIDGEPQIALTLPQSAALARSADGAEAVVGISVPIKCNYGYYYGTVDAEIVNTATNAVVGRFNSTDTHSIYEGKTATATIVGAIPHEAGDYAVTIKYTDDDDQHVAALGHDTHAEKLSFKIDAPLSSVGTITIEATDEILAIYDLTGSLLPTKDAKLLQPGIYIAVTPQGVKKIAVK